MFINKKILSLAIISSSLMIASSANALSYPSESESEEMKNQVPETFSNLLNNNEKIINIFDTEQGYKGYVIEAQGQPIIIYQDEENNVAFSGMMLGAGGKNITQEHFNTEVPKKDYSDVLENLKNDNTTLTEGAENANAELWILFEPNCPHCNAIFKNSRELVENGELKIHWMPVAFLSNTSTGKVAHFWQSENRLEQFIENEALYDQGGVEPLKSSEVTQETRDMLEKNASYMRAFDSTGTPTIISQDSEGKTKTISRSMSTEELRNYIENL